MCLRRLIWGGGCGDPPLPPAVLGSVREAYSCGMGIAGHHDGQVVILEEVVNLDAGARVELTVPAPSPREALADAKPGEIVLHPWGIALERGSDGNIPAILAALRADDDNAWLDAGDAVGYAAKLRKCSKTPRYTF